MKLMIRLSLVVLLFASAMQNMVGQQTETLYLSGTGKDKTVEWDFFCTAGNNSGKWSKIAVPSNWELQGFGKYDYGHAKDSLRGKESGLYKYNFKTPANWKDKTVEIIFEGAMTDTEVKINGKLAGAIHQGGFYQFRYDITKLLNPSGDNLLEVKVDKHSANASVNKAERFADYWIFGGIYRPVYLEASPKQFISHVAIDAKADGSFTANLNLKGISKANEVMVQLFNDKGQKVGTPVKAAINKKSTTVTLSTTTASPALWSSEFPNLYKAEFTLMENGKSIHTAYQKYGYRTVELRPRDGVYVNGVKIKFKGVNHHSFWPSSGRTQSKELSITDAKLIKEMNMNAVRMSHYPPDQHFLDVCDSLGLYVLDELAGWHGCYDTPTGTRLIAEMINRDVNHPSVVMWVNGNEGGHNREIVPVYSQVDIQKRHVVQAWEHFNNTDTQHYINYDYGNGMYFHGHDVVFPTEFLHGLYDGGHGAGLHDYWEMMYRMPLSAGGFLWVFSDEGVVRSDKGGIIDNDGSHAPDGIVGPYREKEGSFFAIKEIWSPIYMFPREITPAFDGQLDIENRYHFTNTNQCKFTWKLTATQMPGSTAPAREKQGSITSPSIEPTHHGYMNLNLPEDWKSYNILNVTATDPNGNEIFTWSFPISLPSQIAKTIVKTDGTTKPSINETGDLLKIEANGVKVDFNKTTGLLVNVANNKGIIPFNNGPVLAEGDAKFKSYAYKYEGNNLILTASFDKGSQFREITWTVYPSGWVKLDARYYPVEYEADLIGLSFSFPESEIKSVRWLGDGPYRVWKNRMQGNKLAVWEKEYNNTVTGEESFPLIYPEFKGFHSRLYWAEFTTKALPFTVVCGSEDIFLHLFTPQSPKEPFNTAPKFPSGNISFMHGITPIGTKSQKPENMGPSGKKNMLYTSGGDISKDVTLWFDFSAK